MIPSTLRSSGTTDLLSLIIAAPVLHDADEARRTIADWLSSIDDATSAAIAEVIAVSPEFSRMLHAVAESSPYLFDLIRNDPGRLLGLLRNDPERSLTEVLQAIVGAANLGSEAELMSALRRSKATASLLIAICDIGGVWPVLRVTTAMTDIADACVRAAVRFLLTQEMRHGKLTPPDAPRPERGSGLIVLAMGKMGAGELNFSSDIDLIVFFDPSATSLVSDLEPQPFFVRIAQGLSRILQQRSGEGYVFRVDLRLRPDPASKPIAVSVPAALTYYEREGRTWERAAMIKARACAGDIEAGEALLAEIAPFVWRKHLDFAALADVHEMKRQMQAFRAQTAISVEGHNVKVGRGGIREIEFFAQTQQLIAGGRHPELRVRPTLAALDVLTSSNWITVQARDELSTAYEFLRRVEHRLQMIADEQTHALPDNAQAMARFANFMGYGSRDDFAHDLLHHLGRVQLHYERLFEGDPAGTARLPPVDYRAGASDPRVLLHLTQLGFAKPPAAAKTIQSWLNGEHRALRPTDTRQAFEAFLPVLIQRLADAEDPDHAVTMFDQLLHALHRGGRLIALLSQHHDLVALLALVLCAAPRLGEMLARQPQMLDGLIDPRFFGTMPNRVELSGRLAASVADADSYEEFLDRLRLFGQECLFLIGARILSGTVSARQAGTAFADVADGIVDTVHRLVGDRFAAQYGHIAKQQTAIVAMGKLGGREMTASSDLDLIMVYDFDDDQPNSDGDRSLQGAQYFARLTQRLIGAFTTRTNYGILYDVDMRLRPSGRSGPLATRLAAFAGYQQTEAWTWEHMALTRARVISGSASFGDKVERLIRSILVRPRDKAITASDVREMRAAIALEKGEADSWDIKYAAGGMIDIDFIAQYLQLVYAAKLPEILDGTTIGVLERASRFGLLETTTGQVLIAAARLYQDLLQILRLCVSDRLNPQAAGSDLMRVLARAGDAPDFSSLEARLRETQSEVRVLFDRIVTA